jgi:hypothetical protein
MHQKLTNMEGVVYITTNSEPKLMLGYRITLISFEFTVQVV